ncbi:MAG: phosphoglycerate kinase, partial [Sphingomonadales bacterium]
MISFDSFSFKGQKALVRVDFNVPLNKDLQITDDTRMRAALPTINSILQQGGSVILMSHLGRPKDGPTDKYSLRHLLQHLINLLPCTPVYFADDCIGAQAIDLAASLKPGDV